MEKEESKKKKRINWILCGDAMVGCITIHQININQTGLNRAAIMRQLKLFYWPQSARTLSTGQIPEIHCKLRWTGAGNLSLDFSHALIWTPLHSPLPVDGKEEE